MAMRQRAPDAKQKLSFEALSKDQMLDSIFQMVNHLQSSMRRVEGKVDSLAVSLQEMREGVMRPGLQNPRRQNGLNGPIRDDDDDDSSSTEEEDSHLDEGFMQDGDHSSFSPFSPFKQAADESFDVKHIFHEEYDSKFKDENENIKNQAFKKKSETVSDKSHSGHDDKSSISYTVMTVYNTDVGGEIVHDEEDNSLDSTEMLPDDPVGLTEGRTLAEYNENFLNMANEAQSENRFSSDRHGGINKTDPEELEVEDVISADKESKRDLSVRKINEDDLTTSDMSEDETGEIEEIHDASNSATSINGMTKVPLDSSQEVTQSSLSVVDPEEKFRVKPGRFRGILSWGKPEDNRLVFFNGIGGSEEISHQFSPQNGNFQKTQRRDDMPGMAADTESTMGKEVIEKADVKFADTEPEGAFRVDELPKSEIAQLSVSPETTDEVEEEIDIPNNRPNNQAAFGLKNLQGGNIDNRFTAEGHDDSYGMYAAATARRSLCSNAQLIQNGIKRQAARSADSARSHAEQPSNRNNIQDSPETIRSELQRDDLSPLDVGPFGGFNPRASSGRQTGSSMNVMLTGDQIEALISSQKIEAQNSRDPKSSSGIDTVILLDTSSSMDGEPLKQAKRTIFNFLDGLEFNAIEYDLEENVAVVTFGKENKIVQHFTNNFDLIKETVGNLTAAGPSPLWIGMALSLTEIATRGGDLTMGHMTIKPRLLVITDGYVTSKYGVSGEDALAADTQAVTEVEELLTNKFQGSVSSISCVSVGPHCADVVHKLSSGRVFSEDDIEYLAQFFRTQNEASSLLAECSQKSLSRRQLMERLNEMGLTIRSMEDIQQIVSHKIELAVNDGDPYDTEEPGGERAPSPAVGGPELEAAEITDESAGPSVGAPSTQVSQQNQEPTDFVIRPSEVDPVGNVSETYSLTKEGQTMFDPMSSARSNTSADSNDVVEDIEGPLFGTPVKPHPSSPRFQDRHFIQGTTIGSRKNGLVKVAWDDGSIERVHYGVNGVYDIVGLPDDECINHVMKTGARVQRGPDWKWGDQDGGPGHIGVVTKTDENKKIIYVIWPHGGQGNYRYGHNKKFDIVLSPSPSQQVEEDTASLQSPDEKFPCWQYLNEEEWRPFLPEIIQIFEQMSQKNTTMSFLVKIHQTNFRINLTSLQARNTKTQEVFSIRRIELTKEELQELFEQST